MVAAWMSADTGVGPAIASGSQLKSGICALFPVAASSNEHQHQHREHEEVEEQEELAVVALAVHVGGRVQVDQRGDAGDEEAHGDRERIHQERSRYVEAADRDPVEE